MLKKLRERHREHGRRLAALQDLVREEPGEIDGVPVVHLVVDDEAAWRQAWDELRQMGHWPLYRGPNARQRRQRPDGGSPTRAAGDN